MAANVVHSSSTLNNVEEHKRVSFGGEKQIVYDDGIADDYSLKNSVQNYPNSLFTAPDAPPNIVTVKSENCEVPRPISPPTQLEEHYPVVCVSPVLPSLLKKMESESTENPFRPDESLYHEVDPIVEAYRRRPFPPSPSTSPIPSTPLANGYRSAHQSEYHRIEYKEGYNNGSNVNGVSTEGFSPNKTVTKKRNCRTASLAEARSPAATADGQVFIDGQDILPPPEKAEIVHIEEKKKKCGCCCLQ